MRIAALALSALAVAVTGCASAPTATEVAAADYGAPPLHYEDAIRRYFDETMKDPGSIQYREISAPEQSWVKAAPMAGGKVTYGWKVHAMVNGKNSYGAYVGFKTFSFLFRGETIVDVMDPET